MIKANEKYARTKNALLGFAAGDSLSWQALHTRSLSAPAWTRRIRRESEAEAETAGITKLNQPFTLNTPVNALKLAASDNTEWAAFTAGIILNDEGLYNDESHIAAWLKISDEIEIVKGSIAVKTALHNMNKGIGKPECGQDNPHYFDDSAMVRAVVIGAMYPGAANEAAKYAEENAAITNSLDGITAAKAIAAAVSKACTSSNTEEIIEAALKEVPADSWTGLKINEALKIVRASGSLFAALPELNDNVIGYSYNYGTIAPENLALTLAVLMLCKGDISVGITAALSFAKTAGSVPAFVGALCGAMSNDEFPQTWIDKIKSLRGICIPGLKGLDYYNLCEKLNLLAAERMEH